MGAGEHHLFQQVERCHHQLSHQVHENYMPELQQLATTK